MTSGLSYLLDHVVRSIFSGSPSYQPIYSLQPSTSRTAPSGSSITTGLAVAVALSEWCSIAAVSSLVGSAVRICSTSFVRKAVRGGLTGVSLATDHRTIDARFLSRETLSATWLLALANVAGFSQSMVQ